LTATATQNYKNAAPEQRLIIAYWGAKFSAMFWGVPRRILGR